MNRVVHLRSGLFSQSVIYSYTDGLDLYSLANSEQSYKMYPTAEYGTAISETNSIKVYSIMPLVFISEFISAHITYAHMSCSDLKS